MSSISPLELSSKVLFQHLLTGRRKPFLASYKITYRCNLRCQQCPFIHYSGADASFAQVCNTLEQLRERGNLLVVLEGGEPMLWQDGDGDHSLADIIRYARERFACVGITTNGTLPLMMETDIAWVSIDGFAATHNRLRQADIFDRVIANIRQSPHPRLYAHITANAENAVEIPALVRFLAELVKGVTIQFYYPYSPDDRLYLPRAERGALLDQLIALKREGYPVLNSTAALRALKDNRWRCRPWLVDCANPDGSVTQGCYLQNRADIDCEKCGFSPYTEASLAFQGKLGAIIAGLRIFFPIPPTPFPKYGEGGLKRSGGSE